MLSVFYFRDIVLYSVYCFHFVVILDLLIVKYLIFNNTVCGVLGDVP